MKIYIMYIKYLSIGTICAVMGFAVFNVFPLRLMFFGLY